MRTRHCEVPIYECGDVSIWGGGGGGEGGEGGGKGGGGKGGRGEGGAQPGSLEFLKVPTAIVRKLQSKVRRCHTTYVRRVLSAAKKIPGFISSPTIDLRLCSEPGLLLRIIRASKGGISAGHFITKIPVHSLSGLEWFTLLTNTAGVVANLLVPHSQWRAGSVVSPRFRYKPPPSATWLSTDRATATTWNATRYNENEC